MIDEIIRRADFRHASLGGAPRGEVGSLWVRVTIRPVVVRGKRHFQIGYFDGKKHVAKNFTADHLARPLDEVFAIWYSGVHLSTATEEIDIRTTKKGKVLVGRRKVTPASPPLDVTATHDRIKDVPLPEGRADHVLEVMGVLTASGRVRPAMRGKFTQINEFLKHLRHVLDDTVLRSLDRPVEILDCGCGSSYLTLAAHHYLNTILGVPARVTGVDVNDEVIRKSVARAEGLGADRPAFVCGRIDAGDTRPDIVFALHACDTATDDAIARAVLSGAGLLMCVPCCHHHLNQQINARGAAGVLRPVLRHGILHERAADLVTDAFRALALRIMGYRTEVVEFVSPDHTARNLMIRAVRGAVVGETMFVDEYRSMCEFWGVKPFIEEALGEPFRSLLTRVGPARAEQSPRPPLHPDEQPLAVHPQQDEPQ